MKVFVTMMIYDGLLKMNARAASTADAMAIARIYNEGIEDRTATFETRLRRPAEIENWFDGKHPIIVVEEEDEIIAFASTSVYRPRTCYTGVAEFSVYTARAARRHGAGRVAMLALIKAARDAGLWKLVSRVFPENGGSRYLLKSIGFREVGTYRNHARLDGVWRDVIIVEKLL